MLGLPHWLQQGIVQHVFSGFSVHHGRFLASGSTIWLTSLLSSQFNRTYLNHYASKKWYEYNGDHDEDGGGTGGMAVGK